MPSCESLEQMVSDLTTVLRDLSLAHLGGTLSKVSFTELSVLERLPLLNKLKDLGVTKLPERQKLATGISKVARGQPLADVSPAKLAMPVSSLVRPDGQGQPLGGVPGLQLDADVFGRLRGGHQTVGVCGGFVRFHGTNENDTRSMMCASCGRPSSEHLDLGDAQPEALEYGDGSHELDISQLFVDGRTGRVGGLASQPHGCATGGWWHRRPCHAVSPTEEKLPRNDGSGSGSGDGSGSGGGGSGDSGGGDAPTACGR